MRVVVEMVGGARAGMRWDFLDPQRIRFGRHPDSEIAFDPQADRDASAHHAELRRESEGLFLYDLDSANGTRIGGAGTSVRRARLRDGEEIEFGRGGPRCRVRFDEPAATATTRRSRRWRLAGAAGALLLLGLGAGLGLRLAAPTDHAPVAATTPAPAPPASEPPPIGETTGATIARRSHAAIFLFSVETAHGGEGFCTAFVAAPGTLATNAHCVALANRMAATGRHLFVVENGGGHARLPVRRMTQSPDYRATAAPLTPDVGLLHVDQPLPAPLPLATRRELLDVRPGAVVYSYGFPAELADPIAPEATFVQGVVGRVTRLDGEAGSFDDALLIQHSAFTSAGTSGSPIFDAAGRVIAVNSGAYTAEAPAAAHDRRAARAGTMIVRQPLQGYNFGMRIDLLQNLFREADK